MRNLLILCLFLGFYTPTFAQNKKVLDSLNLVYQTAKHDTTKILILTHIAFEYGSNKPDTSLLLAEKALQMSEKIGFEKGKENAYYQIGRVHSAKGKYPQALKFYQNSLSIAEKMGNKNGIANNFNMIGVVYENQDNYPQAVAYYQKSLEIKEKIADQEGIAYTLNNLGNIYHKQGNYPQALISHQKSMAIKEKMGNQKGVSVSLNNIGNIYRSQGNDPQALTSYQKSLEIREKLGDKAGMAICLNNIGNIYRSQTNYPKALEYYQKSLAIREKFADKRGMASSLNNIGLVYEEQADYPKALEYHQKSLKIKEQIGDKKGVGNSLNNIGTIYLSQSNYPEAFTYYQKSLEIREKIGDKYGIAYILHDLAKYYQKTDNYEKSIEYALRSLQIAQEIKAPEEIRTAAEILSQTYKLKQDYLKALSYYELYKQTNDSLVNVEKTKAIANLEAKVEVQKKEGEIDILNKNQALLEKDNQLQKIENERQRNARFALEKQAEADRLLALAQHEKDQRKQDSLLAVATQRQLEADKLKANEKALQAENKARSLEVLKEKEAKEFQQKINYSILLGLSMMVLLSFFIYRAKQQALKAKRKVETQNQEISHQKEEISLQNEVLELKTKELEKVSRTKDKLFAIIGHDLRSPIASLHSLLTLITIGNLSKDQLDTFSKALLERVDNTIFTLDNLLHWANSQMKGMESQPKTTILADLAKENFNFMQSIAEGKKINLDNLIPAQAKAWADTNQINLVFRNLISNALKFTPEHGNITLKASLRDNYWEIAVQDTGIGIPEAARVKIFQHKQYFSTQGTKGEQGTGLGLQLCQEFVEKNGGKIWVESEQGKGTTFFFTLPILG